MRARCAAASHWSISFSCSVIGGMLSPSCEAAAYRPLGVLELAVIPASYSKFAMCDANQCQCSLTPVKTAHTRGLKMRVCDDPQLGTCA